jgi:hypothetical protein
MSARTSLLPTAAAAGSLAVLATLLLYLCARPLSTADTWWHLKMGEVHATQGLALEGDPLLHTVHEHPPEPHSWLFGVAIHAIDRSLGLQGLRIAHGLAVAGILVLAFSILRRESVAPLDACFATCVFIVLSWYRFAQLRPDLVSILSALLLYRLLLERGSPPTWPRVAGAVVLMGLWANAHSVFAAGLLLVGAALMGLAARAGLARWKLRTQAGRDGPEVDALGTNTTARRVGTDLFLGLLATILNPRGIQQHLTFFASSGRSAIWSVLDDWQPFDPFAPRAYGDAAGFTTWLATDLVIAGFVVLAAVAFARFVARPSLASLERSDPTLVALGAASIVAALVSVRFLWMLFFPLLFLLRFRRTTPAHAVASRVLTGVLAVASIALAISFPQEPSFRHKLARLPSSFSEYVSTPYEEELYPVEAVGFLRETGLEGNLFNTYPLGGFLAYWLAPKLRTFIDSRSELFEDYRAIVQMRGFGGEDFLDVLERREVDLFLGTGAPPTAVGQRYCVAHLERAPGWTLVSRSMRHAIYLRANGRNRENLERVVAYYDREGVPFDATTGLRVGEVIRSRPDWAEAHGIVPPGYSEILAAREDPDPELRFRAQEVLGETFALAGAYAEQIEVDREAIELQPMARVPRYRLVYGLLRLDRPAEALKVARELRFLAPKEPRTLETLEIAREYARRKSLKRGSDVKAAEAMEAPINELPLILRSTCASCRGDDWVRRFFDTPLAPEKL